MKTDLEIASGVPCRPIGEIAASLGLTDSEFAPYGRNKAKIEPGVMDRLADRPNGRLVLVTAISPTPAGEGKTTTTIGLADALRRRGLLTLSPDAIIPTPKGLAFWNDVADSLVFSS